MEYHKLDELRQALGREPDFCEMVIWEGFYAHPINEVISNGISEQEKLRRKQQIIDLFISQNRNN